MVFSFQKAVIKRNDSLIIDEFNWKVRPGEGWWICGDNGSGKTTLLDILKGQIRLESGRLIFPEDVTAEKFFSSIAIVRRDFSLSHLFNKTASFYQQRYYFSGVEETPLVIDFIASETSALKENIYSSAREFGFENLLDKHIISLSTGEGRRIHLLMLLINDKKIICFDDPFAGLDAEGKNRVINAIQILLKKKVTVLITSTQIQPPGFINNILFIKNRKIEFSGKVKDFTYRNDDTELPSGRINIPWQNSFSYSFKVIAEMSNITIKYDEKIIQKDFSWKINQGEKWMLTGPNGSGKSTLLSLIYGDNPLAYSYELIIFDRKRGSGETIWDIKKRIGYFSSELQQFFPRHFTFFEAVLTGYCDHLTIKNDLSPSNFRQAEEIIEASGLTKFKNTPLWRLSFSQCRIALVCRALVKFPPVVILDEPCQGLDKQSTLIVNRLIDKICGDEFKTLIYVTHKTEDVPKVINRHLVLGKQK